MLMLLYEYNFLQTLLCVRLNILIKYLSNFNNKTNDKTMPFPKNRKIMTRTTKNCLILLLSLLINTRKKIEY